MADAKMQLPFIYTIPIISWIIGLFKSRQIEKKKKKEAEEKAKLEAPDPMEILDNAENAGAKKSKHEAVAEKAKECGADIKLTDYVFYKLGDGLQKREEDFAAEVQAQLAK